MKVRYHKFSLILAIISIMAINFSVLAQSQEKNQPLAMTIQPGGDPLGLLMLDSVQKELKLTSGQIHRLEQISNRFQATMCKLTSGFEPGVIPPQHQRHRIDKETKKVREQIMQVLRNSQSVRFRELLLQLSGWGALLDPEMIRAFDIILGLSLRQKWRLDSLGKQVRQQMMEIHGKGGDDQHQRMMKKHLMDENGKKVWDLLSNEQRAILKRMTGKKFTLTESSHQLRTCP